MAALKTTRTDADVPAFLAAIADVDQRADAVALCDLMHDVTGEQPALWGDAMVGFGSYRYRYASGHTGEWFAVGFSPRKRNLTLYFMDGFGDYEALLAELGPHSTSKSCLYVKRLDDLDRDVLRQMVAASYRHALDSSVA